MLRVTRSIPAPPSLESRSARANSELLRDAVTSGRAPESLDLADWGDVSSALEQVFSGKCAYCETLVTTSGDGAIHHFRPVANAIDADGAISLRHYWWLAYEWSNLFLTCSGCNRYKASRFPVVGKRAEPGEDLANENAVLLNPCADEPDAHLTFVSDGMVVGDTERGRATIDILALNRESLIQARHERAAALFNLVDTFGPEADLVQEMLGDEQPFAAMCRQVLNGTETYHRIAVERQLRLKELSRKMRIQNYQLAPTHEAMGETAKQRYFGSTKWIERIVLTNFRPIRALNLDFSRSVGSKGPWTMLLGENGCGKTSILQALALVLMGPQQRQRLVPDASRNLRRGEQSGSIEVYLTGNVEPLVLRFSKGRKDFEPLNAEPALLLGYGSTRLPSRGSTGPTDAQSAAVRVDNLFDPLLPMTDPTEWLMSLDDELFIRVNGWLATLLALREPHRMVRDRKKGTIELRAGQSRASLTDLSDGYQSMLILACDVMRTLLPLWGNNLEQAEGIVLVDELGAHLHPRWRMRIVDALRDVLPRVQFIATTHDPLCLRGLEDGEVIVLRRNAKQDVISISDLPPVKGLRVEQLLASEFFGLGSTRDPQVDDLYDEYYRLRGQPSLTRSERERLADVEESLAQLDQLGTTTQERLVYRAAGDFIASRRTVGDQDRAQYLQDDEIRQQLSELWSAGTTLAEDEI